MRIIEFASAKVNLYLHVGPPRQDGRHPLDSLVAFANLGDILTISADPQNDANAQARETGLRLADHARCHLSLDGPFANGLHLEADNLVLRAARSLLQAVGPDRRKGLPIAQIRLTKNLPIASGIGGGSADAAATLRGLNRFWKLQFSAWELEILALPLGADVPSCVLSAHAHMRGIGEILTPSPVPALPAILVNHGGLCPTGAVYQRFDAMGLGFEFSEQPSPQAQSIGEFLEALHGSRNDLEAPAVDLVPAIGEVLQRMRALPGVQLARMSGSGATCFALFADQQSADRAAMQLRAHAPHWWVQAGILGGERHDASSQASAPALLSS